MRLQSYCASTSWRAAAERRTRHSGWSASRASSTSSRPPSPFSNRRILALWVVKPGIPPIRVAMTGAFGYELDLERLSPEDCAEVTAQIADFKRWQPLLATGRLYRLRSPFEGPARRPLAGTRSCGSWER